MADPAVGGIVESLSRQAANTYRRFFTMLGSKHLDLLKELLPQPNSVGYLVSRACGKAPAVSLCEKQLSTWEPRFTAQF